MCVCVQVWLVGWVGGWASDAAKSFKLGEGMPECSRVILIAVKFLCQESPQPAALQFHSDWRRSEGKKSAQRLKERRSRGQKQRE